MERLVVWSGLDAQRWEVVHLDLSEDGVVGTGTQIGVDPLPYRLDYRLEAREGFVTTLLDVRVQGAGWSRGLHLRHDGAGAWSWDTELSGDGPELDPPGEDRAVAEELREARDCDLGLSPLTNLMPIRRHELHITDGAADVVVAWVSVPDLRIHQYPQRYETVRLGPGGAVVRFIDRGLSAGFTADLVLDPEGVVEIYPELARTVRGKDAD
jgi:hypothetical protein